MSSDNQPDNNSNSTELNDEDLDKVSGGKVVLNITNAGPSKIIENGVEKDSTGPNIVVNGKTIEFQ
jgi:hypothetical protein